MHKHATAWGMLLGLLFVAAIIYAQPLNWAEAYTAVIRGGTAEDAQLALCAAGMLPVGAFLAALPGRIRRWRRKEKRPPLHWQDCVKGAVGGFLMLLGAGMAGGGMAFHGFGGAAASALSGWAALAVIALCAWGVAALTAKGEKA